MSFYWFFDLKTCVDRIHPKFKENYRKTTKRSTCYDATHASRDEIEKSEGILEVEDYPATNDI